MPSLRSLSGILFRFMLIIASFAASQAYATTPPKDVVETAANNMT